MPQPTFIVVTVSIMVVGGFLGGLVNYFSTRRDDPDGSSFWKSATLGIAASLLVPLFLNMISSNLLDSIRKDPSGNPDYSKTLVFLGFCLVAAISSTAFIKTLSDRILQEAKEAKKVARQADKKVSEVQSVIQPIVEKETEAAPEDEAPSEGAGAPQASVRTIISDDEKKLLQELANGKWVLRTLAGLGRETKIPKPEVEKMMDELRKKRLVDYRWLIGDGPGEKKRRWYITKSGRDAIAAS